MNPYREALEAIVTAMDVPRDRLRRLQGSPQDGEPLRKLAVAYKVGGAMDTEHQAVLVAKAVLAGKKKVKEGE